MTELIREFVQSINERLRNKVFGPFLIAFLAWNWEAILMIIASKNVIEFTIYKIKDDDLLNVWSVFIVPLGISLVYNAVAGYLTNALDWLNKKSLEWKIINKYIHKDLEISNKLLLGKKEVEYQEMLSGKASLTDLNSKIEALQKSNEQYINENEELRKEVSGFTYASSDRGLYELQNAKDASDRAVEKWNETFNEIVGSLLLLVNSELQKGNFQLSNVPDSIIKNLLDHGFIGSQSINNRRYYKFTQAGRDRHFALQSIKNDGSQESRS